MIPPIFKAVFLKSTAFLFSIFLNYKIIAGTFKQLSYSTIVTIIFK
jgi:hypothetical protein